MNIWFNLDSLRKIILALFFIYGCTTNASAIEQTKFSTFKIQYDKLVQGFNPIIDTEYKIIEQEKWHFDNTVVKNFIIQNISQTNLLIFVDIYEYDVAVHAQEKLSDRLKNFSAPQSYVLSRLKDVDVGDMNYSFGDMTNDIQFVRNNIIISLRSSVPVLDLAKEIDAQILEASGVSTNINKSAETKTDKKSKTDKTK